MRRGIGDYTPLDRVTYRSKRNKRVLLRACHEQSPRNRCSISLDPIQKQYQETTLFEYSDIRIVHLPAKHLSSIDTAFVRVYDQDQPLSTPQYLKANTSLPQKGEPTTVLGFPQQSYRILNRTSRHLQRERDLLFQRGCAYLNIHSKGCIGSQKDLPQ